MDDETQCRQASENERAKMRFAFWVLDGLEACSGPVVVEKLADAKLELGTLAISPGVKRLLVASDVQRGLARHQRGDWGNVCEEDAALNDEAIRLGTRVMSVYAAHESGSFWVITEADRSVTSLLLPEEY